MRPRLFTVRNALLFLVAAAIFGGMSSWIKAGMPLPGASAPSTAGKIVFVSDRDGHSDLWMMDGKTGDNAVALTNDAPADQSPVFSANGGEVAFVSEKGTSETVQVYVMDARPGATAIPLTRTSATKQKPLFGAEGLVYYLTQGKVLATRSDNFDTDQLLPEADELRSFTGDSDHPGILTSGGVAHVSPSPDGKQLAAVFQAERGQALVLVTLGDHHGEAVVLGAADHIQCQYLADGRLIASYINGEPLAKPVVLYNAQATQGGMIVPPIDIPYNKGRTIVLQYTSEGVSPFLPALPFQPSAVVVSPDGKKVAISNDEIKTNAEGQTFPGLLVVTLSESGVTPEALFAGPTHDPVWSPDGTTVAFVSDKDIYAATVGGGADSAKNLTNGKGSNSSPFWSPAIPKK